jgi:hypothetical protein
MRLMRGSLVTRRAAVTAFLLARASLEILLHHRAAIRVAHDLLIAQAVALADRLLGEDLMRRVAIPLASMMLRRVATCLA